MVIEVDARNGVACPGASLRIGAHVDESAVDVVSGTVFPLKSLLGAVEVEGGLGEAFLG
jgi:hypothetical protein